MLQVDLRAGTCKTIDSSVCINEDTTVCAETETLICPALDDVYGQLFEENLCTLFADLPSGCLDIVFRPDGCGTIISQIG